MNLRDCQPSIAPMILKYLYIVHNTWTVDIYFKMIVVVHNKQLLTLDLYNFSVSGESSFLKVRENSCRIQYVCIFM